MAGNKRKGAPTLYELLAQSTLKEVAKKSKAPVSAGEPQVSRENVVLPAAAAATVTPVPQFPASAGSVSPSDAAGIPATRKAASAAGTAATARLLARPRAPVNRAKTPRARQAWAGLKSLADTIGVRPWLLFAAALVAVLLILVIVRWVERLGENTAVHAPPVGSPSVYIKSRLAPVPFKPPAAPSAIAATPGAKALIAKNATWLPNRWYLVILTTLPQYAQRDAEFIARHGISVMVVPQGRRAIVVAVRGFRNRASAGAIELRRRVVQIGRLLPESKKLGHSIWSDAYYARLRGAR